MLTSVPLRSDAYRRLCDTDSTIVRCQLTELLSIGATLQRCPDVRLLRLHSVLPASPVMTAQLDAPATLNSQFPLHKSHDVRGLRFFVVAHFNNISSIFRDWFRWIKTNRLPRNFLLPHKSMFVKYGPVYRPRCSRHAASLTSRILCSKNCLQFMK